MNHLIRAAHVGLEPTYRFGSNFQNLAVRFLKSTIYVGLPGLEPGIHGYKPCWLTDYLVIARLSNHTSKSFQYG
jgi:hypothetical protein